MTDGINMTQVRRRRALKRKMLEEHTARRCHEMNKRWCELHGDDTQASWEDAPGWQRESAIVGVTKAAEGATPEQLHESWCASKWEAGWTRGDVKDANAKTHPCLVPYTSLPPEQLAKDAIFLAVVSASGLTAE